MKKESETQNGGESGGISFQHQNKQSFQDQHLQATDNFKSFAFPLANSFVCADYLSNTDFKPTRTYIRGNIVDVFGSEFFYTINPIYDESKIFGALYCSKTNSFEFEINRTCETFSVEPCEEVCAKTNDFHCCGHILAQQILQNVTTNYTDAASILTNDSYYDFDWCLHDRKVVLVANDTGSLCDIYSNNACSPSCESFAIVNKDRIMYVLLYIAIAILLCIAHENVFRCLDTVAMSMAKHHKADYGKQKLWCAIGSLVGPSLAALVVYITTFSNDQPNYESSLVLFVVLCVASLVFLPTVNLKRHEPAKKIWKATTVLFKNTDFLVFTFVLLVLGGTWGFQVNFKNVYLTSIGAPTYLVGVIDTFAALTGLPVLYTSKWLTNKIGNENIAVLSVLSYGIKCLGLSFLQTSWPAFLLELTSAINFYLFWVACMNFCTETSPEDLKSTVIAFAGSIHFSIGRALGSLGGGLLMSFYGGRIAFQVIAVVNIAVALFYGKYLHSKRIQKKKILK
ncbi:MFS_1_like domain-containing protein [Caerostris extrusa]|uniref:MFS_1_like domain-containing protein n=1 Tax=Caerostris extrusa TaxID=172846 RepID=A0AAV4SUM6_CAEEX|nr:MFS_1_like domain-containing protein [Caerostris extrusa]